MLVLLLAMACGGSKANVRQGQVNSGQPAPVDVTTASAIVRDLPQYFEANGSLTGDEQTDVAPQMAGKVVAVGVVLREPPLVLRHEEARQKAGCALDLDEGDLDARLQLRPRSNVGKWSDATTRPDFRRPLNIAERQNRGIAANGDS